MERAETELCVGISGSVHRSGERRRFLEERHLRAGVKEGRCPSRRPPPLSVWPEQRHCRGTAFAFGKLGAQSTGEVSHLAPGR